MKPIDQTRFGNPDGNCFNACIASILEIPLEDVPEYIAEAGNYYPKYNKWLEQYNLEILWMRFGHDVPNGYAILCGKSDRGLDHAVVTFKGEIVHDPHPSKVGLIEGTGTNWDIFVMLDPSLHIGSKVTAKDVTDAIQKGFESEVKPIWERGKGRKSNV